ncbi:hypothetical protein M3Y96_00992100 [Aphelenchoides besseyi]|nr:hypothetical protein M3Y96_00992100 [Aphelenchoides besseyi]
MDPSIPHELSACVASTSDVSMEEVDDCRLSEEEQLPACSSHFNGSMLANPLDSSSLLESPIDNQKSSLFRLPPTIPNLENPFNQTITPAASSPIWEQWICMLAKTLSPAQWHAYWSAYTTVFGVHSLPAQLPLFNDLFWSNQMQQMNGTIQDGRIIELGRFVNATVEEYDRYCEFTFLIQTLDRAPH